MTETEKYFAVEFLNHEGKWVEVVCDDKLDAITLEAWFQNRDIVARAIKIFKDKIFLFQKCEQENNTRVCGSPLLDLEIKRERDK